MQVGYRYDSVVEDVLTGYFLQSKGWRSVYLNPTTAQFLGSAVTNLNDQLIQGTRWQSGLLEIGLSKNCPLIHSPSKMQFLHKMCATWVVLWPLDCLWSFCFATIPPLCFLYGISLYPKVSTWHPLYTRANSVQIMLTHLECHYNAGFRSFLLSICLCFRFIPAKAIEWHSYYRKVTKGMAEWTPNLFDKDSYMLCLWKSRLHDE